jgi:transposase
MRYSRCGANGELLQTSKGQQRQVQEKDDLGDNGRHHAGKDSGVLAALTLVKLSCCTSATFKRLQHARVTTTRLQDVNATHRTATRHDSAAAAAAAAAGGGGGGISNREMRLGIQTNFRL